MKSTILKTGVLAAVLLLSACSSDDNANDIDTNLLLGEWFKVDFCQDQNKLILEANGDYEWFSSGNLDCADNESFTLRTFGTFAVSGDDISFNKQGEEIIDQGTSGGVPDFELRTLISSKVTTLTESSLTITEVYENDNPANPNIVVNNNFER